MIASKIRKYLRISLIKVLEDLGIKMYKTLMKETERDTNKWKNNICSGIEKK